MSSGPPVVRSRRYPSFGCILFFGTLLTCGLLVWIFTWANRQSPWVGRVGLIVVVVLVAVLMVRDLVTPARSRTTRDLHAAGVVIAGALTILYFGVARPVLDEHRDRRFESRLAERRAAADSLEAITRELPDPATAEPAAIRAALARASDQLKQRPAVVPKPTDRDEYERFTDEQKEQLAAEGDRALAAMRAFTEKTIALRAALAKKKDKA